MAKVIKLKDRQGSVVLPLTRSQLVQVSSITGLDLLGNKEWTKASVQDALEALMTYATTIKESNATALKDIDTIKSALEGVLDTQKAVVNKINEEVNAYLNKANEYTDIQDTAYLKLAYDYTDAQIATAIEGVDVTVAAGNGNVLTGFEIEDGKLKANSVTTTALTSGNVTRTATTGDHAVAATTVEGAIVELSTKVDTAYTNAEAYTDDKIAAAVAGMTSDNAIESGKVITQIVETDGVISTINTAYLNASDIKRTSTFNSETNRGIQATTVEGALEELEQAIQVGGTGSVVTLNRYGSDTSYTARYEIAQGGSSLGYIDIPKDMVATDGSLVYGSMSGDTFTEAAAGDPYIMMTIANGDPFYIPVKGLVEYNEFAESTEIGFTDNNHNVTAYINEIDTDKIKHNNKSVTTYLTDMQTELDGIESTLVSYEGRIASNESDLSSYNTRITALETTAAGLSYTVTDDSAYIIVTPSTTGGATTFTISTTDIASDTNLQALQTSYNNMNTELTNMGVFYEQVGTSTIADPTLDTF